MRGEMWGERRMKHKLWAWNWSGRKLKHLYVAVWLAREGFTGAAMMDHCIVWGRGKFTDDLGQLLDGWLQTLPVYSFTSHWQQREVCRGKLTLHKRWCTFCPNICFLSKNLFAGHWLCKFSFYWEIFCIFFGVRFFFFFPTLWSAASLVWAK